MVETVDDPSVEHGGKAFRVLGRVPRAELRGCSDTYASTLGGLDRGRGHPLLPPLSRTDAATLVAALRSAQRQRRPFDDEIRSAAEAFARDLRRPEVDPVSTRSWAPSPTGCGG